MGSRRLITVLGFVVALLLSATHIPPHMEVPRRVEKRWGTLWFRYREKEEWVRCLRATPTDDGRVRVLGDYKAKVWNATPEGANFQCRFGANGFAHNHPNGWCGLSSVDHNTLLNQRYIVAVAVCSENEYVYRFRGEPETVLHRGFVR